MSVFVQDHRAVAMAINSTLQYQHLALSLGYLKNLIMDLSFTEYSEIFC